MYMNWLLSNITHTVFVFMLVPFNNFLPAYLLQISQLLPFSDIEVNVQEVGYASSYLLISSFDRADYGWPFVFGCVEVYIIRLYKSILI